MEDVPDKNRVVSLERGNVESRKKGDKHQGAVRGISGGNTERLGQEDRELLEVISREKEGSGVFEPMRL